MNITYCVISQLGLPGRLGELIMHRHNGFQTRLTESHGKSENARAAPWLRGTTCHDLRDLRELGATEATPGRARNSFHLIVSRPLLSHSVWTRILLASTRIKSLLGLHDTKPWRDASTVSPSEPDRVCATNNVISR